MTDTLTKAMNDAPDGDLYIEVELVMGGWVGYVYTAPGGAIVPADRPKVHARTIGYPTRAEAIAALPNALAFLTERVKGQSNG